MNWENWVAIVEAMSGLVLTGVYLREASDAYEEAMSPWDFITHCLCDETGRAYA